MLLIYDVLTSGIPVPSRHQQERLNFGVELPTGVIPKLISACVVFKSSSVYQKVLRFPKREQPTVFQYVLALDTEAYARFLVGPAGKTRVSVTKR